MLVGLREEKECAAPAVGGVEGGVVGDKGGGGVDVVGDGGKVKRRAAMAVEGIWGYISDSEEGFQDVEMPGLDSRVKSGVGGAGLPLDKSCFCVAMALSTRTERPGLARD